VKANGFPRGNQSAVCCTSRNLQIPEDRPQQLNLISCAAGGCRSLAATTKWLSERLSQRRTRLIRMTRSKPRFMVRANNCVSLVLACRRSPPGESVPDSRRFGVFWMKERGLATALTPSPAEFKPSVIERLGLQKFVSPAFRMALRNLERKPWQAVFTALGRLLRGYRSCRAPRSRAGRHARDQNPACTLYPARRSPQTPLSRTLLAQTRPPSKERPPPWTFIIRPSNAKCSLCFNTSNSPLEIPVLSTNMLVLIDRQQGRTDDCGLGGYR